MQVYFVPRENGPERLVTEAEIHFDEGGLAGMRLVGFCLWRSPDGDLYVTFPSRAFGVATERKYFDYLRALDGSSDTVKRVASLACPHERSPTPSTITARRRRSRLYQSRSR